jgi:hypothetical protein
MKFALEVFVCGETQGPVLGENFAECVRELFSMIHAVPEQFPATYTAAICDCLSQIATKVQEMEDGGDGGIEWEMNGTLSARAYAGDDSIDVTLGDDPSEE